MDKEGGRSVHAQQQGRWEAHTKSGDEGSRPDKDARCRGSEMREKDRATEAQREVCASPAPSIL